jgi:hypothetical protein
MGCNSSFILRSFSEGGPFSKTSFSAKMQPGIFFLVLPSDFL